ncbi:S-adenosylmethionine decarboxylase proenzyme 4 [Nymphaea thermarum]|nr:S-adenosylmethionine decarboxylase proenzyme 4 [Nymphaea thermarum]
MAAAGFEGFEKRLELKFTGESVDGLRQLNMQAIEDILEAAQCTIVSGIGNRQFDAYVLSESSLFIYPKKIIVKTCGTTQLLKAIPALYTRGSFIFPKAQPYPHRNFEEEVSYLNQNLPSNLTEIKTNVLCTKTSHSWHVYSAADPNVPQATSLYTIEMCMTGLDRELARKFYRQHDADSGDMAGKEMTVVTGIADIHPGAIVCDHAFDPCGYSMNSINDRRYSTIHVTPEDGHSYASFECTGEEEESCSCKLMKELGRVVEVFRPMTLSVAVTGTSRSQVWKQVQAAIETAGLEQQNCKRGDFPAAGTVVFQAFHGQY